MKRETKKLLSDTCLGAGIMLTVVWIVGFWLIDPNPYWAVVARGLVFPFVMVGVVLSAQRVEKSRKND